MGGTQGRRDAKPLSPHEPEMFGVGGTQGRRGAKVALVGGGWLGSGFWLWDAECGCVVDCWGDGACDRRDDGACGRRDDGACGRRGDGAGGRIWVWGAGDFL